MPIDPTRLHKGSAAHPADKPHGGGGNAPRLKNSPTLFRKKPVAVEAFQLGTDCVPDWAMDAVTANTVILQGEYRDLAGADIKTLEGRMHADVGDWIIRGVRGELYPCKPDIFAETYEPATMPTPSEALRSQLADAALEWARTWRHLRAGTLGYVAAKLEINRAEAAMEGIAAKIEAMK